MPDKLTLALAQLNPLVGDISGSADKLLRRGFISQHVFARCIRGLAGHA